MTAPSSNGNDDDHGLITSEGVDEGSAASTAEGEGTGGEETSGAAPHGRPATEQDTAAPLDVETEDLARDRDLAPGQQLAEGEG